MDGHKPLWCPIGEGVVGWSEQVDALVRDGYKGWLSLETHWAGPGGDKHEASMICGRHLVTNSRSKPPATVPFHPPSTVSTVPLT